MAFGTGKKSNVAARPTRRKTSRSTIIQARKEEEATDIRLRVIRFPDMAGIDLETIAERKITLNAKKYPADSFRGYGKSLDASAKESIGFERQSLWHLIFDQMTLLMEIRKERGFPQRLAKPCWFRTFPTGPTAAATHNGAFFSGSVPP
jgi:hypothetical protein